MIPRTKHGMSAFALISALQKYIRRGEELEAMRCAIEMMHSSKAFHSMVTKRLQVIAHEDCDNLSRPDVVPFVKAAMDQANAWYDPNPEKLGKSRMCVANSIMLMCRAPKARTADHLNAATGWADILEDYKPVLPDWVHDQHTTEGKRKGRGLDYFREHSTRLVPAPTTKDPYEDRAYELWAKKEARSKKSKSEPTGLFEDAE